MGRQAKGSIGKVRPRRKARVALLRVALASASLIALSGGLAEPAMAQATRTIEVTVPGGALEQALLALGNQGDLRLIYPTEITAGRISGGASGTLTADAAVGQVLAGTGLTYRFTGTNAVTIEDPAAGAPVEAEAGVTVLETISITDRINAAFGTGTIGEPPEPYAGGQVATGARLGVLGNRSVFDTPISVVALTEKTIEDQQARTTSDLFKNDASVVAFQNSNPNGTDDVFSIRGFLTASSNTTFDGLFGLNFRQPSLAQIERVEITKGPSSLLNGQAGFLTVGGNVNYVPKRAPEEPLTEITARYVSDASGGVSGDFGRRYGENNEFGVRVNTSYLGGETSIDDIERENGFGSAAFDYRGETVRASLDLDYSDFDTTNPVGGTPINPGFAVPRAPENTTFYGVRGTDLTQEKARAVARVEWDFLDDWTFSLAGGVLDLTEEYRFCNPRIVNAAGDVNNDCYSGGFDALNQAAEALVRGQFETDDIVHRSAAGVSYNDSSFSSVFTDALDRTSNIYNPADPSAPTFAPIDIGGETSFQSTTSYFYNHEIGFFDERLLLLGGVRETRIKTEAYDGATGATLSSYDERALTPAVGLVVKPVSNVSLYANYIEALEPGGAAPVTAANAGAFLDPLVSEQIEVGAKADFGSFGATIAAFEITRQNTFVDPVTNIFAANGQQKNRGIELTLFGEPIDGVRVLGGVMFIDAELTKTAGGAFDGNTAIGVPDFQARFGAEWDVPFAEGLTLTGSLLYTDGQFVDQANTQTIPSWTRLDLGARYNFDVGGRDAVLRVGIENVLDEDYWSSVDRGSLYAGAPRTYLVSTSFRF